MVLCKVSQPESRVLRDDPLGRLQLADEQLQHGRLARAVGPDNTNPRVQLHIEVHIPQQRVTIRIAESDAAHLHDGRRQLLDLVEGEMHRVLALGRLQHGHLLELLDARLRLGRLGRVVPELVDEGPQVGALRHLVLVLALGCLAPLFLGGVEGVYSMPLDASVQQMRGQG